MPCFALRRQMSMRRWRIPSLLSEVSCSMVLASPLLSQQIRLSSISFDPLDNPSADKVIKSLLKNPAVPAKMGQPPS